MPPAWSAPPKWTQCRPWESNQELSNDWPPYWRRASRQRTCLVTLDHLYLLNASIHSWCVLFYHQTHKPIPALTASSSISCLFDLCTSSKLRSSWKLGLRAARKLKPLLAKSGPMSTCAVIGEASLLRPRPQPRIPLNILTIFRS